MSSYLTSLLWGTSQVDDAVDKATSELLPSGAEDIALNLEICDQIRSKSVAPKDAMRALKRRLNHKNPNVQLLALGLTDTCIKNGGDLFLSEIASREFMDNLVSILKIPALNMDVKNKILRLIQNWAVAFEGKPSLSYVGEVYKTLQHEGFNFPPRDPAVTSSAMVDTQTAPEWIDSDVCLRCRTPFTFTNRKHHCRNCGQVFDQQCTSKVMALPHFGITQEVRVCDSCYTKLNKKSTKIHRTSQSVSGSRHHAAREFADADLQRAIQLSLQEVGAAGGYRPGYVPSPSPWQSSEPPLVDKGARPYAASTRSDADEEDDPDLKAAIEASLREANAPQPSAPLSVEVPAPEQSYGSYGIGAGYPQSYPPSASTPRPRAPAIPTYDLEPLESDAIMTFSQTVEQVQTQGGRDLSRYPAVTELFDKANSLRPKLAMSLSDTGRKEELLSEMHEKLSEAVKLYDKLLTEQVSRPAWRTPSVAPQTTGYQSGYNPRYQADGSYSHWTPEAQTQRQTAQAHAEPSYFSAYRDQSAIANGAYVTSPSADPYVHAYQPQQQSPPEVPRQFSQDQAQPQFAAMSPVTVPQYGAQAQLQTPAPPPIAVPYPPPVAAPVQPPASFQSPSLTSIPPPVQVQSPPVPFTQPQPPVPPMQSPILAPQPPPPTSTLTRHNTLSSPPAPAANAYVHRNNAPSYTSQQLQQLQQIAVPAAHLPHFPVAPTSSPQSFVAFSPPVEPERKEALLIDL
ncbi:Vacuolar protein sorting-associated protein [Sparassis crispa]|uniref:Vacuolar protein sorting-associated protein 27 n=1 Tax=Sparassis crispa TaxID=139825 RepID=A0A401G8V7_9APHY|nr:Vacuolar protein sorting-associated protein [Sparassis crispa]GBE78601.1 Vacuolar protein sorting-associated protein [Sparassis crispa]